MIQSSMPIWWRDHTAARRRRWQRRLLIVLLVILYGILVWVCGEGKQA